MTPEENLLLKHIGTTLLDNIAGMTAITILYGIFILLFSLSTSTLIQRGLTSHPSRAMFMLTLVSFIIASLYWAADMAVITIDIRSIFVDSLDLPLDARIGLRNAAVYWPESIAAWTSELLPIISDAVVIWRAWVLCSERRWMMIAPLSLLLGTIATTFAYLGLTLNLSGLVASASGTEELINSFLNASLILSLATNAVSTSLIAYKLWIHRKFVVNNLGLGRRKSHGQKVLILLVESGVLYCGLQLATLILNVSPPRAVAPGSAKDIAAQIFYATYTELSAMYPTIIVFLVNRQRSMVDICGVSTALKSGVPHDPELHLATIGHLSFALHSTNTPSTSSLSGEALPSIATTQKEVSEESEDVIKFNNDGKEEIVMAF